MNKPNFRQLSSETGISESTIRDRWATGKRGRDLVAPPTTPQDRGRARIDRGETLIEISFRYGLNHKTLSDRWHKGERGDELRRPIKRPRKYLGFTAKQLGDLIVKRTHINAVNTGRVCNFLKYHIAKGQTEEEAVRSLLDHYGVTLIKK